MRDVNGGTFVALPMNGMVLLEAAIKLSHFLLT